MKLLYKILPIIALVYGFNNKSPTQHPKPPSSSTSQFIPDMKRRILMNKIGSFELYPPCAFSEEERGGWNSTSNNEVRKLEKIKAKKKVKEIQKKFEALEKIWLIKYGYKKFVGDWFYADQLSSDTISSAGGFNMKKGGYYPDGSYKESD